MRFYSRIASRTAVIPLSALCLLVTLAQGADEAYGASTVSTELPEGPEFVLEHSTNATAGVDGSVILNCRVRHIGSRQVSWGRGIEVLTGGLMVFADDQRFQPLHVKYSEDWALRIRSLRREDEGWYFCQVGTSPPMSHDVYLKVADPKVEILGGPDMHINRGSRANLTCVIEGTHQAPGHVRWTHNHKLAQFDMSRRGVTVETHHEISRTVSSFLIEYTLDSDSGLYFCEPDGIKPAKVSIIVVNGDQPAAMQTGSQASTQYCWFFLITSFFIAAFNPFSALSICCLTSND